MALFDCRVFAKFTQQKALRKLGSLQWKRTWNHYVTQADLTQVRRLHSTNGSLSNQSSQIEGQEFGESFKGRRAHAIRFWSSETCLCLNWNRSTMTRVWFESSFVRLIAAIMGRGHLTLPFKNYIIRYRKPGNGIPKG